MAAFKTNCYKCGVEVVRKLKRNKYVCDDCKKEYQKEYHKEYYQENKEEIKEYNQRPEVKQRRKEYDREYREKNKDEIKEKKKEYLLRPEVKQRRKEYIKEYIKKRYRTDPIFKFSYNTRRLTRYGFEQCALGLDAKSASTEFYLGYAFKQAWKVFKAQMDKRGMTVEDFLKGRVQIDHIKPRAAFPDLSKLKQAKECFHYTNLQPLWAEENLEKGAKLDWKNSNS